MNTAGASIQNHKERGEWAELRFMARVSELGFRLSKPWGDSARYDFALEVDNRFLRVQVKSTISRCGGGYVCTLDPSGGQRYTASQVDFFAVYVIPEDVWYVLPTEVATQTKSHFLLAPSRKGQKYEAYKEAWHLLRKNPQPACPEPALQEPAQRHPRQPDPSQPDQAMNPTENRELTTGNYITNPTDTPNPPTYNPQQPGEIAEMRGAIEPAPTSGFDSNLLRNRLAACFHRIRR